MCVARTRSPGACQESAGDSRRLPDAGTDEIERALLAVNDLFGAVGGVRIGETIRDHTATRGVCEMHRMGFVGTDDKQSAMRKSADELREGGEIVGVCPKHI